MPSPNSVTGSRTGRLSCMTLWGQALLSAGIGEGEARNDLIYYSSIPWLDFTDLKHAGRMSKGQSIPRISTGRLVPVEDKLMMSVSVELNHGLADGYHVAQFFRLLDVL